MRTFLTVLFIIGVFCISVGVKHYERKQLALEHQKEINEFILKNAKIRCEAEVFYERLQEEQVKQTAKTLASNLVLAVKKNNFGYFDAVLESSYAYHDCKASFSFPNDEMKDRLHVNSWWLSSNRQYHDMMADLQKQLTKKFQGALPALFLTELNEMIDEDIIKLEIFCKKVAKQGFIFNDEVAKVVKVSSIYEEFLNDGESSIYCHDALWHLDFYRPESFRSYGKFSHRYKRLKQNFQSLQYLSKERRIEKAIVITREATESRLKGMVVDFNKAMIESFAKDYCVIAERIPGLDYETFSYLLEDIVSPKEPTAEIKSLIKKRRCCINARNPH